MDWIQTMMKSFSQSTNIRSFFFLSKLLFLFRRTSAYVKLQKVENYVFKGI